MINTVLSATRNVFCAIRFQFSRFFHSILFPVICSLFRLDRCVVYGLSTCCSHPITFWSLSIRRHGSLAHGNDFGRATEARWGFGAEIFIDMRTVWRYIHETEVGQRDYSQVRELRKRPHQAPGSEYLFRCCHRRRRIK